MFKTFLWFKTKQNTLMSDEEHSDSEFYYSEEQEMAERKASRCGSHFDKVEASGDTGMKSIYFRNKKWHIINYLLTSTVRSCCIDFAMAQLRSWFDILP